MIHNLNKIVIGLVALLSIQQTVFADDRHDGRRFATPRKSAPQTQRRPTPLRSAPQPVQRFRSDHPGAKPARRPKPVHRQRGSFNPPPFHPTQRWHDYYRPGYKTRYLPRGHSKLRFGGLDYFFFDGFFYRPFTDGYFVVDAPIGAIVLSLPSLHFSLNWNGIQYFRAGNTFYRRHPQGYLVVPDPGFRGDWR